MRWFAVSFLPQPTATEVGCKETSKAESHELNEIMP